MKAIAIVPIRRTDLYIAHTEYSNFPTNMYLFGSYRGQFYDHCFMTTSGLSVSSLTYDDLCMSAALGEYMFVEVTEKCKYLKVDMSRLFSELYQRHQTIRYCMNYNFVQPI